MGKYIITRVTQDGSVTVGSRSRKCDALRVMKTLVERYRELNRYAIFYITAVLEDGSYYTIAKESTP